jgi:hypothetical protein
MRFLALSPLAALGLLALTAGLVVALYLLRPPPRRVLVPSHLLWLRLLREKKRRSDAWRWWISLLLALGIGLGMALGLTRPEIESLSGRLRRIAIVVDNGPTMATRSRDGRTRFEHALEGARKLLGQASAGSEFLMADTAGQILASGFSDRQAALEALNRLRWTASAEVEFPPLHLEKDQELYFISDGVLVNEWPEEAEILSVFEPAANAGITAFEVRPLPADPSRYQAYLEAVSYFAEPREVALLVSGAGRRRIERSWRLEPGERRGETLDLSGFPSGPLRAALSASADAFDLDNLAFSYLPGRSRVVLVTPGNPFLENVLRAHRGVELTVLGPQGWDGKTSADVFVLDRFAPEKPPPAPALLFRPPAAGWLPVRGEGQFTRGPFEQDATHPLLLNVALQDLGVLRAERIEAGATEEVILGSRAAPLIVVASRPLPYVLVGFDLRESNFPLLPGFAVFLSNALSWLGGDSPALPRTTGWVEVPLAVSALEGLEGKQWPTVGSEGRTFFEATAPGLYTARDESGSRRVRLAIQLANPRVSQVSRSRLAGKATAALPEGEPRAGREPWVYLFLAAVVLLVVEWWTFHRRLTV